MTVHRTSLERYLEGRLSERRRAEAREKDRRARRKREQALTARYAPPSKRAVAGEVIEDVIGAAASWMKGGR